MSVTRTTYASRGELEPDRVLVAPPPPPPHPAATAIAATASDTPVTILRMRDEVYGPPRAVRTYTGACVGRDPVVSAALRAGALARADADGREATWVRDAQRGSEAALEHLFRHHWPRAYRAALVVVGDAAAAEDIAQESFLAALRALDRFDRGRPFGPWLHRIVVNRAIDWARARRLRRELGADDAPEPAAPYRDTPERARELAAALAGLGAEHRAVIVLRYLRGYTPGEIAQPLDL